MMTKKAPRKKLMRASARRTARPAAEEYDDEEPSMKLSSAFVVVLLLHLVAVGGIYAFKSIEARRAAAEPELVEAAPAPDLPQPPRAPVSAGRGGVYEVQPGDTLIRIANEHNTTVEALEAANGLKDVAMLRVGQEIRIPDATAAPPATAPKPSEPVKKSSPAAGGSYTVVKGDNPVAIARRFGVSYSDLLELNDIDDPRKLQIGQVLTLPAKRN